MAIFFVVGGRIYHKIKTVLPTTIKLVKKLFMLNAELCFVVDSNNFVQFVLKMI